MAYVYLRQSTMGQVTITRRAPRPYALKDRAQELGWAQDRIRVLDPDLGLSGTQNEPSRGFQDLGGRCLSRKSRRAVFALEASYAYRARAAIGIACWRFAL